MLTNCYSIHSVKHSTLELVECIKEHMTMKNLIVLFTLLIFVGCTTKKETVDNSSITKADIENIHWSLIEFDGKPLPPSVVGKVHIMLSGKDNKLSGSNGCNRIMGSYEISNGMQISFSDIASSLMACHNEGWNEVDFNQMFETINNFSVADNKLMLNVGKRAPLAVFAKAKEDGITNKYWKLTELQGQKVTYADNQESEQYFIIKDDGSIYGYSGCNSFSGTYELKEDVMRIKFDNLISTLRACPDADIRESEFLDVFNLADNYTLSDDKLRLNVGRRAPLAVFEAVYF